METGSRSHSDQGGMVEGRPQNTGDEVVCSDLAAIGVIYGPQSRIVEWKRMSRQFRNPCQLVGDDDKP